LDKAFSKREELVLDLVTMAVSHLFVDQSLNLGIFLLANHFIESFENYGIVFEQLNIMLNILSDLLTNYELLTKRLEMIHLDVELRLLIEKLLLLLGYLDIRTESQMQVVLAFTLGFEVLQYFFLFNIVVNDKVLGPLESQGMLGQVVVNLGLGLLVDYLVLEG
jgi:hypothetical protein